MHSAFNNGPTFPLRGGGARCPMAQPRTTKLWHPSLYSRLGKFGINAQILQNKHAPTTMRSG
jgi:hypothetical protein